MRLSLMAVVVLASTSGSALAAETSMCSALPSQSSLQSALKEARGEDNGGLNNDMWGVLTARDGTVCAVAYTGQTVDSQWPGSRIIAEEKAVTANAFSSRSAAFSTANMYAGSQPGGFLYGINESSPLDTNVAYAGPATAYGTESDPMVGKRPGGAIIFGGGLALYNSHGEIVGGVGVSGDTSCADHNISWRTRHTLKLDYVPKGIGTNRTDAIVYDITLGKSKSGFGHPTCGNKEDTVAKHLPDIAKAGQ